MKIIAFLIFLFAATTATGQVFNSNGIRISDLNKSAQQYIQVSSHPIPNNNYNSAKIRVDTRGIDYKDNHILPRVDLNINVINTSTNNNYLRSMQSYIPYISTETNRMIGDLLKLYK